MMVDLDIDADNTAWTAKPEQNPNLLEDQIEDDWHLPGKVVLASDADDDGDGIPDYTDGFNRDGITSDDDMNDAALFAPVRLELISPVNPATTKLLFKYTASDPAEVTCQGVTYTLPADKCLRVWTKPGQQARNKAAVTDGGDFVPADTLIDAATLGLNANVSSIFLYVEGVMATEPSVPEEIRVIIDPDGTGPINVNGQNSVLIEDAVRVTVLSNEKPPWDPGTGTGNGPGSVNLASGMVEHKTDDIIVYNPAGPDAAYGRVYNGKFAKVGQCTPGMTVGWRNGYDIMVDTTSNPLLLRYFNGAVEKLIQRNGTLTKPTGAPYLVAGQQNGNDWSWLTITWNDQTVWRFEPRAGMGTRFPLVKVTDCTGHAVEIQWGTDGRVLGVTGGAGGTTPLLQISYTDNLVATVTDAQNTDRLATYTYTDGNLSAVNVLGVDDRWQYSYLASATYPVLTDICSNGSSYGFTYSPMTGLVNKITDPNGHYSTFVYTLNAQRNIGHATVQAYDVNDNVIASWSYTFNTRKCVTAITENPGARTTDLEYLNLQNPMRPTKITLPDDRFSNLTYDIHGNVLTATNLQKTAGGERVITTTFNYDYADFALGRVASVEEDTGDGDVVQASYTYYGSGLLHTATVRKPGATAADQWVTTSCEYNDFGDITHIESPGAHDTQTSVVTLAYGTQKRGQPTAVSVSGGGTTLATSLSYYESRGLVRHAQTAGQPVVRYTYNAANQPTVVTTRSSASENAQIYATTTLSYQFVGGPQTGVSNDGTAGAPVTTAASLTLGATGELLSSHASRVVGETSTARTVAALTYDELYRPTTLADARNMITHYTYTAEGFPQSQIYPGNEITTAAQHDEVGRPGQVTVRQDAETPPEQTWQLNHTDPEGLLRETQLGGITDTEVTYTDRGDLNTLVNAVATLTPLYNDYGDQTGLTTDYTDGPTAQTIQYTYYPDGSRKTMALPDGTTLSYTYDGLGRLTMLADAHDGRATRTTSWTYDTDGLLTARTIANGNQTIARTTYAYEDPLRRLTALYNYHTVNGVESLLSSYTDLTYDGAGQCTGMQANLAYMLAAYDGEYQFDYAGLGELAHEQLVATDDTTTYTNSFSYDATGNPASFKGTAHTYNANSQLTDAGYAYDARGNPTSYAGVDCIFDAENHLINYNDGAFTAGYRPDGLRGWTRDAGVGLGGKTFYLYDGETLVTEIPPEGEGGARVVVWGANGLISRDNTFYLFDPLGNVAYRLLPNGAIANSSVYDAYGTVTTCAIIAGQLTVIDALDPYQYKGQYGYYTDTATGLVLCTYRYYDPQLGRWLTRDPIGYDGGMNQYGYCGGDPVNLVDADGNIPVETVIDIVSLGWSLEAMLQNPSWANAGFLAWDIAGTLIPYVPGSYVAKGAKLAKLVYKGEEIPNLLRRIGGNKLHPLYDKVKSIIGSVMNYDWHHAWPEIL